jgi:hypothetical protein
MSRRLNRCNVDRALDRARRHFELAKSEGDPPAKVNPADLARYIATVLYGMAVQASGGASRTKLQHVVEMALRTLPM